MWTLVSPLRIRRTRLLADANITANDPFLASSNLTTFMLEFEL